MSGYVEVVSERYRKQNFQPGAGNPNPASLEVPKVASSWKDGIIGG